MRGEERSMDWPLARATPWIGLLALLLLLLFVIPPPSTATSESQLVVAAYAYDAPPAPTL
jgi:hypothetical protein